MTLLYSSTSLHSLIEKMEDKNHEIVGLFFDKIKNNEISEEDQKSYFETVCRTGKKEILKVLMDRLPFNSFEKIVENSSDPDIIKLLIPKIKKLEKDRFNSVSFYKLVENLHDKDADFLRMILKIAPKTNINFSNYENAKGPLQVACQNQQIEIVKVFLENPLISLNEEDDNGDTPLITICRNGNFEIAKLLVSMGKKLNLNLENRNGETAIQIAQKNGYNKIVELLK